jgi:hypothetical protein
LQLFGKNRYQQIDWVRLLERAKKSFKTGIFYVRQNEQNSRWISSPAESLVLSNLPDLL